MIRTGIIGGAGYTAGELLRILINHPDVEIVFVNSNSNAGNKISDVHGGLLGETNLLFTAEMPLDSVDVLFFCTAHGDTKKFIETTPLPERLKIIDLSTDYRAKSTSHNFVYGLPELNKAAIKQAKHIANPGCFATAIQLGLLPLAKAGLLTNEVHVSAITGSTGAGQKPGETTHFSWRNNNLSVYQAFEHRHLAEIKQSICQLQPDFHSAINFIPLRGNFTRGIFVTMYCDCDLPLDEAKKIYANFYSDAPFTLISDTNIDLKQAVNTNKCILYLEKYGTKLFIISIIDNLLKGASGQAVQNMNLLFGLDEKAGLHLKSIGF